jgi:hypothetical protein
MTTTSTSIAINRATLEIRRGITASSFDSGAWLIDPDLSALASVPEPYWKVVGDVVVEMTSAEKVTADAVVLASQKLTVLASIKKDAVAYIEAHYDSDVQRGLIMLQLDARTATPPLANRAAYIQQGFDWSKLVLGYSIGKEAAITAAVDQAALGAITWDFAGSFDAGPYADPRIMIAGAAAIGD